MFGDAITRNDGATNWATARVAVCVARLVASKRLDRAIACAAGAGVDVLVVVGDGPERGRLERLARRTALDVRFVGAVDRPDALAWIGAADIVLHASEAEETPARWCAKQRAFGTPVVRVVPR